MNDVLIIEDDAPFVELLRYWFGSREIRIAHSLAAANRMIAAAAPKFIVIDLALPDSIPAKTLSVIRDLKKAANDAVVIVITGFPDAKPQAFASGADAFISKDPHANFFDRLNSALVAPPATPGFTPSPVIEKMERTVREIVEPGSE